MDTSKVVSKGKAFTTGNFFDQDNFGSIIEGLFFTSDGFAVQLYNWAPWFIRRDPNHGDPLLCVAVDKSRFPYSTDSKYDDFYMQIRFLSASNVKTAHQVVTHTTPTCMQLY